MRYTPTLQENPVDHWLHAVLIGSLAGLAVALFVATALRLFNLYGPPVNFPPFEPPAGGQAGNPLPGDTATPDPSQTLIPSETALPTETPPTAAPPASETALPTETAAPTQAPTTSPTPLPTPKPGQARLIKPSGLTVMYVPGGTFKMGGGGYADEAPRHTVILDPFWMGRNQVTNAQYAQCVAAGGCTKPIRKQINPHYYNPAYADHPTVYITWDQAEAYCVWAGGHLPTEAQWSRATGPASFPWGHGDLDTPERSRANVNNTNNSTKKVGSYPKGKTKYGVLDMGGNVREWVFDWYSSRYPSGTVTNPIGPTKGTYKVLRGAAWYDPWEYARTGHRFKHVPGSPGANRGFRCAFPVDSLALLEDDIAGFAP